MKCKAGAPAEALEPQPNQDAEEDVKPTAKVEPAEMRRVNDAIKSWIHANGIPFERASDLYFDDMIKTAMEVKSTF